MERQEKKEVLEIINQTLKVKENLNYRDLIETLEVLKRKLEK